ncbi:hypothetical protein KFL_009940035 [Klebsormidium nitens]|uniref:Reverse transcriptase Ty1/copia-type domain-containing protein n=1 Tax=Klebsormidium nitens TaxID=105231 RepID=A0A1Y1IN87_KLENI|nr:hypothetical protein KFL_009940035 [Klebsormidium nitens]|eukprot:GAQ92365.1 hypothetical protein KFL_009940035 [Klebsormidium nitens]
MITADYIRNRIPSSVHGKTPWEMYYWEKPNLSHLRMFWARTYIHVTKGNRKKMEPRGSIRNRKCIKKPEKRERALAASEMRALLEKGTWELVKNLEGVKPIRMKWIYKIKRDALRNVERYKSWVTAKGYLQKQGNNFEEVYAAVSKHTTLPALLAVVA